MSIYKSDLDISLKHMITKKVMSNINVFGSWVHDRIFCNVYRTSVVTKEGNASKIESVVTKLLLKPKYLSTIATCRDVFCLGRA